MPDVSYRVLKVEPMRPIAAEHARCRACGTASELYSIDAPTYNAHDGAYSSHMVEFYICRAHARQLGAALLGEAL
jgi:ribosomal protein S14